MKFSWAVIAVAVSVAILGAMVADPALARAKPKSKRICADRLYEFSWGGLFSTRPEPRPNGCSPPVYANGKFIGQDPDPTIRQQLLRDPATGYSAHINN